MFIATSKYAYGAPFSITTFSALSKKICIKTNKKCKNPVNYNGYFFGNFN